MNPLPWVSRELVLWFPFNSIALTVNSLPTKHTYLSTPNPATDPLTSFTLLQSLLYLKQYIFYIYYNFCIPVFFRYIGDKKYMKMDTQTLKQKYGSILAVYFHIIQFNIAYFITLDAVYNFYHFLLIDMLLEQFNWKIVQFPSLSVGYKEYSWRQRYSRDISPRLYLLVI